MVKPIVIDKTKLENEPNLLWNTFLDMVVMHDIQELSDVQSIAKCVWAYDSEVQNGGHFQYFENAYNVYKNKAEAYVAATLEALKILGAKKHEKILTGASTQYFKQRSKHPSTVKEYIELEDDSKVAKYDDKYYDCSPDLNSYLEKFLHSHQNEFIEIV
jgi:hypothetical protein